MEVARRFRATSRIFNRHLSFLEGVGDARTKWNHLNEQLVKVLIVGACVGVEGSERR